MKKNKQKLIVYEAPEMREYTLLTRSCIAASLGGSTDSYGENSGNWNLSNSEGYSEENGNW